MLKPQNNRDDVGRTLLQNGQSVADRLAQANDMEQALQLVMYRYRRKLAPWPPRVIETIRKALRED